MECGSPSAPATTWVSHCCPPATSGKLLPRWVQTVTLTSHPPALLLTGSLECCTGPGKPMRARVFFSKIRMSINDTANCCLSYNFSLTNNLFLSVWTPFFPPTPSAGSDGTLWDKGKNNRENHLTKKLAVNLHDWIAKAVSLLKKKFILLRWCKSNCGFALLNFAVLYWNTFLNKCGYIIHHFNVHFSLYAFFLMIYYLLFILYLF